MAASIASTFDPPRFTRVARSWLRRANPRGKAPNPSDPATGARLCFDNPVPDGIANERGRRIEVELAHGRSPVRFHCFQAYVEQLPNLFVRVSLRDQLDHTAFPIGKDQLGAPGALRAGPYRSGTDRKSTRLNSSHTVISYAVFCLKK